MTHEDCIKNVNANQFEEFVYQNLNIIDSIKGSIKFELFDYQKDLINLYENEQYVIVRKFRQGGFTTLTLAYFLWKCLNVPNTMVCVFSCNAQQSLGCTQVVREFTTHLPDADQFNFNKDYIEFTNGSKIIFRNTTSNIHGCKFDYLLFDEAAYNYDAKNVWNALCPTIVDEGKAFIVSSVNGKVNLVNGVEIPNWFYETYRLAFLNLNSFVIFDVDYTKNPKFNPEYIKELRKSMSDINFREEYLLEFLHKKEINTLISCDAQQEKSPKESNSKLHEDTEYLSGIKRSGKQEKPPICQPFVTHPEFPKEPDWDLNDLAELWEDISEHIPFYKGAAREMRSRCQQQYMEDVSIISSPNTSCEEVEMSGMKCDGAPNVVTCQTKLIDEIMSDSSLPKEMEIKINRDAVKINDVPTQISGKAIEYLFKGYVGLVGEEIAIKKTAQIIRDKLQKLF